MVLAEADLELIRIISADLQFLRDEWDENIDDDSLRRTSPVLRRLLVHNDLHRAWKASGFEGQATVISSTLKPILQVLPLQAIEFASAGGANYQGMEIRALLLMRQSGYEAQAKRLADLPPPEETLPLLSFIDEASVIVRGIPVRRRHVIKYVANKLGGAHLDRRRGKTKEEMIFDLLDKSLNAYLFLEKPAIYFELLSIGQAIASSEDLKRFTKRANELA